MADKVEFPMLQTLRVTRKPLMKGVAVQIIFVKVESLVSDEINLTNPQLLDLQLVALEAAINDTREKIKLANLNQKKSMKG